MKRIYNSLFLSIYLFIKNIERGYSNQTDDARFFGTAMFISILELLNLITIFNTWLLKDRIFATFILLAIFNTVYFYYKDRYKIIIKGYGPTSRQVKTFVMLYILISFISFILVKIN